MLKIQDLRTKQEYFNPANDRKYWFNNIGSIKLQDREWSQVVAFTFEGDSLNEYEKYPLYIFPLSTVLQTWRKAS